MIRSNKINIIVAVAVVFALITSIALVGIGSRQSENGGLKTEVEYKDKIFGSDIISVEIIADEDDWQEMLDNATSEQFIMADVIVNGKKFKDVGIRPKGNSSLTQVASSNSDRYSFRLQFDEYIKGQTCFGLESFVLNNMLGDNTYMKEYVSYDLMGEAGVDAPYFGFANIKVNGENWGLYLAVELYNDSYEERVFGDTSGMLYNVKSMDMGGNPGGQQGGNPPAMPDMKNGVPQIPPGGQGQQSPGFMQVPQNNNGGQPFTPPDGNGPKSQPNMDSSSFPGQNPIEQNSQMQNSQVQNHQSQNSQMQNPAAQNNTEQNPGTQNTPRQNSGAQTPQTQNSPAQGNGINGGMDRNIGGKGGPGSSGGSLEYTDDNIDSYSAIFDNVVGKGTESDYKRVIRALKALSEGKNLETYFDIDKILRYLAAHTIVVNLDSYSSNMAQNYYIYEGDGKITILPWDYNLAWGGFQNGSASSVINFPIDTPVSGVEMSSRPLLEKLFSNKEYLERYHSYLQQLIDNYFANGKFEEKINELDALISDYVKNDATAFCTYDEYRTAVSTFITLGNLRAQSIQGQLDGTVPSTTEEQKANPTKLISAGDLKLSDLGSQMGGKGDNNRDFPRETGGNKSRGTQQNSQQGSGQSGSMPQNGGQSGGQSAGIQQNNGQGAGQSGGMLQKGQQGSEQKTPPDNTGRMKQGMQNGNTNPFGGRAPSGQGAWTNNIILIGVLSLVLIVAIVFAAGYKKPY